MPLPLLALALAAFGIGTTEFVIMGLLPEMAGDLSVSIPRAGQLVTGYALGVALGGPVLALLAGRLPRKATLVALMVVFTVGNLGCALAANYGLLMAARIGTSLCHAAFFGIGAVTAANLVAPEKRAQAMALMFSGLTIANIVGVPIGTLVGQAWGWRATFWGVAGIGVVATAAVAWLLPHQDDRETGGLRRELGTLAIPQVWLGLGSSVLASISMFVLFTYIAPFLRDVTGIAPRHVGGVLLLCGVAITAGNLVGARLADWRLMPSLIGIFLALALCHGGLAEVARLPLPTIAGICVWGFLAFAACTSLQARVVEQAKAAPNLASTLNISAFNLGNALGAWIGGGMIARGFALTTLPWAGAAAALVAMGVTIVSMRLDQGDKTSPVRDLADAKEPVLG